MPSRPSDTPRLARRPVEDSLSTAARGILAEGFAQRKSAGELVGAVALATGERLSPRTVGRWAARWRAEQARRAATAELIEALAAATVLPPTEALARLAEKLAAHVDAPRGGWRKRRAARVREAVAIYLKMATPEALQHAYDELVLFGWESRVELAARVTP